MNDSAIISLVYMYCISHIVLHTYSPRTPVMQYMKDNQ